MAEVRPFRAIRYSPAQVPDLARVITQPYDKVTPEMKAVYLGAHPRNFVRLILPDGKEPYQESARLCAEWLKQGILERDPSPAVYVYQQQFKFDERDLVRRAFVACVRVEDFEQGTVLPHERTLSKPKADRLNLLRATQMDFEQIFLLYSDPEHRVDRLLSPGGSPPGPAPMQATDEYGVNHKMWAITDPAKLDSLREVMAPEKLLIADGHHRYETALNYRREAEDQDPKLPRNAAVRFKSCAFVNIADPGLVILPTHRMVKNLADMDWNRKLPRFSEFFRVTPVPTAAVETELAKRARKHAFGLHVGKGKTYLLELLDVASVRIGRPPVETESVVDRLIGPDRSPDYKGLDVTILHALVIESLLGIRPERIEEHVKYERESGPAVAKVDSGEFQAALLMNPTRVEQVETLARKGERMPQKSTDFYPKLVSGFVFFDVSRGQVL